MSVFFGACILALLAFGAVSLRRARRFRRRELGMVLAELRDFARRAQDPATAGEMRFTAPLRSDEDRAHDTIFTVRHGSHLLSLILDTSRARIRWWVLAEWYAADGTRGARFEATFVESAIPIESIRALLQAARGEVAPPVEAVSATPAEPSATAEPAMPDTAVDPFDTQSATTVRT